MTLNLSDFLNCCRKNDRLSGQIDKIYEIVVYAFLDTLQLFLNTQAGVELDCETKRLAKDFRLIQNFFLRLDKDTDGFSPNYFHLNATRSKNGERKRLPSTETAIKIKYIAIDNDTVPVNAHSMTNEQMIIVCTDAEKAVIQQLTVLFGLEDRIRGIIPEHTLFEWYHMCINPQYINSMGKPVIETLNKRFTQEYSSTPLSSVMTHLLNHFIRAR